LDFYVDNSSKAYPKQGLAKCTTCKLSTSLNVTFNTTVTVKALNATHLEAVFLKLQIFKLDVITGKLGAADLKRGLQSLLDYTIDDKNHIVKIFDNPFVGLYGVNNTKILVQNETFIAGFDISPKLADKL